MGPRPGPRSGYNKRLRKLAHTMAWLIGTLATEVSVTTDQVWLAEGAAAWRGAVIGGPLICGWPGRRYRAASRAKRLPSCAARSIFRDLPSVRRRGLLPRAETGADQPAIDFG
jgi:hypothetical protein